MLKDIHLCSYYPFILCFLSYISHILLSLILFFSSSDSYLSIVVLGDVGTEKGYTVLIFLYVWNFPHFLVSFFQYIFEI